MADFRAFRAVRPTAKKAGRVAALPYDVVDREEARAIGEANPDSFLHVDRAEMDLEPSIDLYDPRVYQKAKENLDRLSTEGTMIQDEEPCFYLYELTRLSKVQTGIVGVSSIDDYRKEIIKKHELTREDKEQDRIRHVDVCDANTGPIFLACRYPESLLSLVESWKAGHAPVYDFTADDGITHRVWIVDDEAVCEEIRREFADIPAVYIADGHHRTASAVKVGLKRREANPDFRGDEEFNYFLSVVFPFDQLSILPYNRVVKDLFGHSVEEFMEEIKKDFSVLPVPSGTCQPVEKHSIGMYCAGSWYLLKAKPETYEDSDVVGQLDVSILQNRVLQPLLGIQDPRTDKRIRFVGGSHPLTELQESVDQNGGVAFVMFPTSMEDLMAIADESKLMPPKSTWFEPKLRSGLFIHKLSD